ncbi:hypothetical protein GCM10028817_09040 [Spirosoma pomorum]
MLPDVKLVSVPRSAARNNRKNLVIDDKAKRPAAHTNRDAHEYYVKEEMGHRADAAYWKKL